MLKIHPDEATAALTFGLQPLNALKSLLQITGGYIAIELDDDTVWHRLFEPLNDRLGQPIAGF
jgi:hypothetical protein